MCRKGHETLSGQLGESRLQADGVFYRPNRLDQRDRLPPFGDDDLFTLFGSAKVLGESVLEFPDPDGAHPISSFVAIVATSAALSRPKWFYKGLGSRGKVQSSRFKVQSSKF
jgi:hypothetical protein